MFKGLDDALLWTFASARLPFGMVAMMPLAADGKNDRGRRNPRPLRDYRLDPKPRGFDRLAQAGMIMSALHSLQPPNEAILTALYSSGRRRILAQQHIVAWLLPRIAPTIRKHRHRLIYELVAAEFGKPVKYVGLAERFHVHPNTVTRQAHTIAGIMAGAIAIAVDEGTTLLKERGVILEG